MNNESVASPAGHWSPSTSGPSLEQRIAELEVVYDAAPIGIFLCDRDCRFIRINPYLAEQNGLSVEQHLGKVAWDMIPALQQTLEPIWRRVLDFGESVHKIEVQGETAKAPGLIRYWEASYHPIYNEDDDVVAMCGIVDEITDRKVAEQERAKSAARVQRLLEANLFGVATATLDGLTEVNDAFLRIVGYSRQEFLRDGIDWRKITPPEYRADDMAGLEKLQETGICPAFEKEFIRKDGQRVPVLTGATLLDHAPLRWVAFAIDLSEREAREKHARELLHEMAHRMKNLMAVVCAIAHQLAQTSGSLAQFNGRFAARLQALAGIQDILLRDDWRGAPVRDVILSQLDHCGDLLEHRVVLDGPPVSLCASASQYIGMALHELSTNAMKYGALSNDSGTVTIRWSAGPPEHGDKFRMEWIERGGPPVTEPTRKGYGHRVTTELVARGLDATASEEFRKDGFRWSLVMPVTFLAAGTPGDPADAPAQPLQVRAVAREGAL